MLKRNFQEDPERRKRYVPSLKTLASNVLCSTFQLYSATVLSPIVENKIVVRLCGKRKGQTVELLDDERLFRYSYRKKNERKSIFRFVTLTQNQNVLSFPNHTIKIYIIDTPDVLSPAIRRTWYMAPKEIVSSVLAFGMIFSRITNQKLPYAALEILMDDILNDMYKMRKHMNYYEQILYKLIFVFTVNVLEGIRHDNLLRILKSIGWRNLNFLPYSFGRLKDTCAVVDIVTHDRQRNRVLRFTVSTLIYY